MTKQVGKKQPWGIVRNFLITRPDGTIYLTRNGVRTPFGGVYVHKMTGPDDRSVPHDHPWPFISLIIKGGYDERRINKMDTHAPLRLRRHRRWHINIMRRDDAHYICRLLENPTWTVVLFGKRRRTWGFWEKGETEGQWTWTEFDKTHWEADRVALVDKMFPPDTCSCGQHTFVSQEAISDRVGDVVHLLHGDCYRLTGNAATQISFGNTEGITRNVRLDWKDPDADPLGDIRSQISLYESDPKVKPLQLVRGCRTCGDSGLVADGLPSNGPAPCPDCNTSPA